MLSSSSSPVATSIQNPKLWRHNTLSSLQSFKTTRTIFLTQFHTLSRTEKNSTNNIISNRCAIKCRQSDLYEQPQRPRYNSSRPSSNDSSLGEMTPAPRVYVGHSIYKGKAALTVEPRAPEFSALDSGAFKVARDGFVLLQFAPAAAVRQYDWSRKQVFSLSVAEIGTLISLGARDSCEFFHDPNKGKSDEGKVRKVLKVEPLPDGSGHFFNLSVQNKPMNLDESIYIPVTKAEFAVLISVFNYILPYLLGWNTFANSIKPDTNDQTNNANPKFGGDYEWSR